MIWGLIIGFILGFALCKRDAYLEWEGFAKKMAKGEPMQIGNDFYKCEKLEWK